MRLNGAQVLRHLTARSLTQCYTDARTGALGGKKMKKNILLIFFFLIVSISFTYADENYNDGNGTLVYNSLSEEKSIEIRKFEIKNVEIADQLVNKNSVYKNYEKSDPIGTLEWWVEKKMDIHEICSIKYIGKTNSWNQQLGELWIKISTKKISGWICIYDNWYKNPYENSNYEYLGKIQSGNKIWNIRRLNQWISVWTNLNIRDKPGLSGNKISLIKYEGPQLTYNVVEITEESEIIDGINDRWVKIEYEKGKYGWVFGGYVSVERGGPKYMIPENEIKFLVGQQP